MLFKVQRVLQCLCLLLWLCDMFYTMVATHCSGNQISWVTKNTTFIRCSPCPPCPPGQEFTIPCSTEVLEGNMASCINCPRGKYSRHFSTKPCVHCRTCSKRFTKRHCTSYQNAKCGDCKSGYYKDDMVFDCVECSKCCNDGNDRAPPGCKKVGMCKPRLSDCPPKSTTPPAVPKTSVRRLGWLARTMNKSQATSSLKTSAIRTVTSAKESQLTEQQTQTPTPMTTSTIPRQLTKPQQVSKTPLFLQANKNTKKKQEGNNYTAGFYIFMVLFILTFIGLVFLVFLFWRKDKAQNRNLQRSESYCSSSATHEPLPKPDDMKLSDFMEKHPDECDHICTLLFERSSGGRFYFEMVACKFLLNNVEREAIKNVRHNGDNPTLQLITKLCSSDPNTTVRQFACKVDEFKNSSVMMEVYRKLEPFFTREV